MNDEPKVVEVVELVELGTASEETKGIAGNAADSELGPGHVLGT